MFADTLYDYKDFFQTVTVTRNHKSLGEMKALIDKDACTISFPPDITEPPQIGDVITVRNKNYIVINVEEEVGTRDILYAYVATYDNPNKAVPPNSSYTQQIFNINEVNNSILGSQQNATISIENCVSELQRKIDEISDPTDRDELKKLLSRIETVIEDNQPVSKGTFAKFSDLLKKHSDLISTFGSMIFTWLTHR